MDLEKLKGKLDDGTLSELTGFIKNLTEQRDTARTESIDGRKGLQKKVETLSNKLAIAVEKLGLDSADDIENLPDIKGQAEAMKQVEAKLKRLERELEAATKDRDGLAAKHKDMTRKAILTEALGSHDFLDRDVVEAYISARLEWEGDEIVYRGEGGKALSVKDGVAEIAKAKPGLLRAQGDQGAGVPGNGTGSQARPELGGTRSERVAALKQKFPNLPEK